MLKDGQLQFLQEKARVVRRHVLRMIGLAGSGHPGGSLSCVEVLVTLYFTVMRIRPEDPGWPERDRLVLSKGHAAPALYAVLAERGYFPVEELWTLRKLGSRLQGHPDMRKTPGVEVCTGSLGQGLSQAVGMALAGRMDGADFHVYCLVGDGECEEGQIWEAVMAAAHYRLGNLTVILDHNGLQIDGPIRQVLCPEPFPEKWRAFGWECVEVDGHDFGQLYDSLLRPERPSSVPRVVVAHTVKGKGVSYMENRVEWHGKAPGPELLRIALEELER